MKELLMRWYYVSTDIALATFRPSIRCIHRSHRLNLPCLRPWTYDRFCAKHNTTCFHE